MGGGAYMVINNKVAWGPKEMCVARKRLDSRSDCGISKRVFVIGNWVIQATPEAIPW